MNACTDMLEKYNDMRQEEVCWIFFEFQISLEVCLTVCIVCVFTTKDETCGIRMSTLFEVIAKSSLIQP